MDKKPDEYSDAEIEQRRDEVVRRMANTPPQHKTKTQQRSPDERSDIRE